MAVVGAPNVIAASSLCEDLALRHRARVVSIGATLVNATLAATPPPVVVKEESDATDEDVSISKANAVPQNVVCNSR